MAAMDDRIYAAAPENYLTNFTRLLQTNGPQDAEQNMFNMISNGLDHADYLIVRAPKPALMVTTTRDMFNIQGVLETEREVARIYKAYGKEDNFSKTEEDAPHASTKKNREAMYAFFQKHLNNPGSSVDIETPPFTPEEVKVIPTGQVSTSLGGETVFSLNRKDAEKILNTLELSRANLAAHIPRALESAKRLSGYKEPSGVVETVFTGRFQNEGYVTEKYFIRGEGNYVIPYLLLKPQKSNNKALIYLHPSDKSAEVSAGGEIEWFVRNGFTVLAPDMIGIGETAPSRSNDLRKEWYASILIGRSIEGLRAGDVVRLTRVLKNTGGVSEIYGVARKGMAPLLLHAAAFDPSISRLALIEPYSSYRSIVMNRFYNPGFIHTTVPGALTAYDLPDLAASLAPRKLMMAGVTDGSDNASDTDNINKDLAIIKTAYQNKNAGGQLNIVPMKPDEKLFNLFTDWIR